MCPDQSDLATLSLDFTSIWLEWFFRSFFYCHYWSILSFLTASFVLRGIPIFGPCKRFRRCFNARPYSLQMVCWKFWGAFYKIFLLAKKGFLASRFYISYSKWRSFFFLAFFFSLKVFWLDSMAYIILCSSFAHRDRVPHTRRCIPVEATNPPETMDGTMKVRPAVNSGVPTTLRGTLIRIKCSLKAV